MVGKKTYAKNMTWSQKKSKTPKFMGCACSAEHNHPEPTRSPPPNGNMISKAGGVALHSQIWRTRSATRRGIVFIVHGLAEHVGRYDGFVAHELGNAGYDVAGIDLQGHGRSGGDFGYFPRWRDLRDDYIDFIEETLNGESLRPEHVFLLGHSMGGGLACEIARSCGRMINGVVLLAPLIMPDPKIATPFLVAVSSALSSWLPKLPLRALDPVLMSRDPEEVLSYVNDPLNYHGRIRARVGKELLDLMEDITTYAHLDDFPVLLLHGTDDQVTDPAGSAKYFELSSSADKTLLTLPGMYHELLLSKPDNQKAITAIIRWIHDRS
jgi:acylglycerol lipase